MSDNVVPFPDSSQRSRPAAAVPCPTTSLVTYLTLLDGRLVGERHEILESDSLNYWSCDGEIDDDDGLDGYDDPCARLERKYGRGGYPAPPSAEYIAERKTTALRECVGGATALAQLDDEPLHDADDLRMATQRPWLPAVGQVDELIGDVADRWFDAETLIALQRATLILLDQQEPCVQGWSLARTVGATVWAVGKANGLFGPHTVTQREVLDSVGVDTWISGPGGTVARLLRRGTGTATSGSVSEPGPWGYQHFPHSDPGAFQKLIALGRPELLLGSTRALVIRLRDRIG